MGVKTPGVEDAIAILHPLALKRFVAASGLHLFPAPSFPSKRASFFRHNIHLHCYVRKRMKMVLKIWMSRLNF
jgi:hypothetical protein